MPSAKAAPNATLAAFDDLEFLAALNDVADDDGWGTSLDLAELLGVSSERNGSDPGYGNRCVAGRLAYMKRIECVERSEETGDWRVTAIGHALIGTGLNKGQQAMLAKMKPAERIRFVRELAQEAFQGTMPARQVMRREWRRNIDLKLAAQRNGR